MITEKKITVKVTENSSVIVIRKSVVDMDTDAIVNAANCSLLGGGGVDGAIHRAAGPELLEECRKLGGCNTGDAKITKGYNLKSRFVIHTVGPVYSGTSRDAALLLSCYRKSLDIAYDSGLESVSFPCISTGVYGYPLDEACRIAFDTVCDTLRTYNRKMTVYLCCFSDREFETFSLTVR